MSQLNARLAKLESRKPPDADVIVWCDDPDDMDATIDAMIAEGKIMPGQRVLCFHWTKAKAEPGTHERALEQMGEL